MRFMKRIAAELDAIEEAGLTKREPVIATPQSARIEAEAGGPIVPVMLGDAALAQEFAARMLTRGVYGIGFSSRWCPRVLPASAPGCLRPTARGASRRPCRPFAGTGRAVIA